MNEPTTPKAEAPKAPAISPHAGAANYDLAKWFTGLGAAVLFVALILWTASLTLGVMDIVMPNNPAIKYFAIALYDGGALVWLGIYAYKARGVPQHGISVLMFGLDFLGIVLMVTGGIYLGGQQLTAIPEWIRGALVVGTIGATVVNVLAWYYYHLSAPDVREAIQAQSLEDAISEEAMSQARATVEREARPLGAIMAARATARLKYRLSLPMTEAERAAWDGEVIEASAEDMPSLPAPVRATFWEAVKSFFGSALSKRLQDMPSSKNSLDSMNPQPEEAPQQPTEDPRD